MTVLVTGGAGYIGSHMTYALLDRGEPVVVLDNLSAGVQELVSRDATFVNGNVGDQALVRKIIKEHNIDSVVHFAGSVVVPESVAQPMRYYDNNTVASRSLIDSCVIEKVRHFLFSSTAAVYGIPETPRVTEDTPTAAINPYGRSKLMTEWMLEDTSRANKAFQHIALRYFNVAGADLLRRTGQSTPNATHLIKRACQVALGHLPFLEIFGVDFATPDGTGIRDYVHVADLVEAHLLALDSLRNGACSNKYNCGYGRGFSVREVLNEMREIIGHQLPIKEAPRRAGDPPALVADSTRLQSELKWRPRYDNLRTIISSALDWERQSNERRG